MNREDSEEVAPSYVLAETILGLTRIFCPWWEAPWKITQLYSKNLSLKCPSKIILAFVQLSVCEEHPPPTYCFS